jgi:selenide,water dikinase
MGSSILQDETIRPIDTIMSDSITAPVRLTTFSHGAGCACKLGSADLAKVLQHLPGIDDARVLVDAATRDDAAVFRLSAERALVATVDFFTPIVDDAGAWGRIAATNAISDVYAMGGEPLFALNLVGWPREKVPFELLGDVIAGALEICQEAGCLVLGGHSVDVVEPLFGMAVIGEARPDRLLTNAAARPGDQLVLTKPLGTGILTTARKRDLIAEADLAEAIRCMTTLNRDASRAALAHGVCAGTDVTGFGLLGHLGQMLEASGVAAELRFDRVPKLRNALELAGKGAVPGGTARNLQAASQTTWEDGITTVERQLLADAQTSGGLLLAVPGDEVGGLVATLAAVGTPAASIIGSVVSGTPGAIRVTRRG